MTRLSAMALFAALAASNSALAQSHQPYAGMQARPIKALSDQQIDDLKAGRGMGLALTAELNSYPGPLHVIELADALALSASQRTHAQDMYAAMKSEAVALGATVIAHETELDRLFSSNTVTRQSLDDAVRKVGEAQAALRATHLKYHIAMREILSAAQLQRYSELRGYTGAPTPHQPQQQHHRH